MSLVVAFQKFLEIFFPSCADDSLPKNCRHNMTFKPMDYFPLNFLGLNFFVKYLSHFSSVYWLLSGVSVWMLSPMGTLTRWSVLGCSYRCFNESGVLKTSPRWRVTPKKLTKENVCVCINMEVVHCTKHWCCCGGQGSKRMGEGYWSLFHALTGTRSFFHHPIHAI